MAQLALDRALDAILEQYSLAFAGKVFGEESDEEDDLMLVFGLTQVVKAQNKQYWGRELGMCWERLVQELCRHAIRDYSGGIREGADVICDLVVAGDAIDTKYRIGSGDSGTLKKFKSYGQRLAAMHLRPVVLILRSDNLPAAIAACIRGGWTVLTGDASYGYLLELTAFDMQAWLRTRRKAYGPRAGGSEIAEGQNTWKKLQGDSA
jgi:hypothetical protein